MAYDKWMGLKPCQRLRCLVITYQISCPSNKVWAFHKTNGHKCHTKSTYDQTGDKNLNQLENAINKSTKNHM